MKNALIGNCSHSEKPLIDVLHSQGYFVTSLGIDRSALCSGQVYKHELVDYTDVEAVAAYLSSRNFDLYIPACNELFLKTICKLELAELFGMGDSSLLTKMIDKSWLTDAFKNSKILKTANRKIVDLTINHSDEMLLGILTELGGKVYLKPLVSAGGRGIVCVNNVANFKKALGDFSRADCGGVIAEEKLSGREFSISTLLFGGKVIGFYWDVEISNSYSHQIDASYWHSSERPIWMDQVSSDIKQIIHKYNLQNGIFHLQLIDDNRLGPVVVDVTRRMSGDLYGLEVKAVAGFDLNKFFINSLKANQGLEVEIPSRLPEEKEWKSFIRFVRTASTSKIDSNRRKVSQELLSEIKSVRYRCSKPGTLSSKLNPNKRLDIYHLPDLSDQNFNRYLDALMKNELHDFSNQINWEIGF